MMMKKVMAKLDQLMNELEVAEREESAAELAVNDARCVGGSALSEAFTARTAAIERRLAARAAVEAERRSLDAAAELAEIERRRPIVERMVGDALDPWRDRMSTALLAISRPEEPAVATEIAGRVVLAEERQQQSRDALAAARAHAADIHGRLDAARADRQAVIDRRVAGETRPDDLAQIALNDADIDGLTVAATTADAEVERRLQESQAADAALKTARLKWESETYRVRSAWFDALADRLEEAMLVAADAIEDGAPFIRSTRFRLKDHRLRRMAGMAA